VSFYGFIGFFCFAIAFWPWLQAGTDAPPPVFSTNVQVVNLFAVVHDPAGQIRTDLTKDNFELRVNGKVQTIAYFSQQTNLPLTLGVLVDTSASMLRVFDEERAAASKFLKQVLREHTDQACLVGFDRNVRLLQGLTSSRRKWQSGLGVLDSQTWFERQMAERSSVKGTRHGASTALYDAVVQSSNDYLRAPLGRKAIVLLSDGVDDGSANSLQNAVTAALQSNTAIYSVHIFSRASYSADSFGKSSGAMIISPEDKRHQQEILHGKGVLLYLTQQTGGEFFEATKEQDLASIFARIEQELRSQYSLGFSPSAEQATHGFHPVVLAVAFPGFTIQTRKSYFIGE
jgi:VWFA-related protein